MSPFDVIIVGAGPAGLTAATYLGRFRRRVLILDDGASRARWIPESHNTPGFPQGVSGDVLLARLRDQALAYGGRIETARADTLKPTSEGFEVGTLSGEGAHATVQGRFVILATGVKDRLPPLADLEPAIKRSLVRVCPICDAFEAIDQRIAVLGDGDLGAREAMFLRTYSSQVTLLNVGPSLDGAEALETKGVEILQTALADIAIEAQVVSAQTPSGKREFDCLYLALGCEMQSPLAILWGADHDAENNLIVGAHQETSIDGLYAAGDLVRGLNQIAVATAEAAIAATNIHKRLRAFD